MAAPAYAAPSDDAATRLELTVQRAYQPGLPVLVRVDLLRLDGRPDWATWDATVLLTTDSSSVNLTPDSVELRNGRGSALVAVSGEGDFNLTATLGTNTHSRGLRDVSGDDVTSVAGVLTGEETTWAGVIRVTGTVTVPENHVLTVASNTLVLIDGVTSGTSGPGLVADGVIDCQGTAEHPVVITCADVNANWGQIRHHAGQPSTYRHTHITRGGRAPGEGHTGRAPVVRLSGATAHFIDCVLSDFRSPDGTAIGKTMQSSGGSEVLFDGCILARSRMGPELSGTAVLCTNTYFMDMRGPDDDDAIYIHSQQAGQTATLENCVVYGMDDDGIDTLGADIDIRGCLARDVFDKGMSINNGEARVSRCLVVDSDIGISTKTGDGDTVITRLDHCTILGRSRGIAAENKDGAAPEATVLYYVTNSIILATAQASDSIYTDYDPVAILIRHSNLGESWTGEGNISAEPRFRNADAHDYGLGVESPCIDAGDPMAPADPDGSRTDMGYVAFLADPPRLLAPSQDEDGNFSFDLTGFPNRTYEIQFTDDLRFWHSLMSVPMSNDTVRVTDSQSPTNGMRFYRAEASCCP